MYNVHVVINIHLEIEDLSAISRYIDQNKNVAKVFLTICEIWYRF